MGVVNLYRGLNSNREIFNFNGKLKDHLDLDWEYIEFINPKVDSEYEVKENDVLILQDHPAGLSALAITGIVVGVISLGVTIGVGIYAAEQIKKAQKEYEEALNRIGKTNQKNEVSSIPQLGDAKNERAEGKGTPIILGRHLFAPYFLSEPYLRPSGDDGVDLYWYGAFLCGQTGLCFEKVRNGTIDLVTLTGDRAQKGKFIFQNPGGENPPFYNPDNFIEIVQSDEFTESIFNEKWSDSLGSSVEIGRLKKDNAEVINDIFVDDLGAESVIRETAKFPMRAEIEIMFDGLHGWDSENGVATNASVSITLQWSLDQTSWNSIPNWNNRVITRNKVQQLRLLAEIDFPSSVYSKDGRVVYIRATRNTRMHTGGYRDRAYISAIRTKQYNPNTSSSSLLVQAKNLNDRLKDKFCRMGIKIKVNLNTQEKLDQFNIIASMTGRTANGSIDPIDGWKWDGTWTDKVKTNNPASVLLELTTGLIHPLSRHKDSELDLNSFGKLYEFCKNQKVNIEGVIHNLELECNGVLTSGTRKIDVIKQILATCDGGLYINEFGKLEVYYDYPQTTPIALLNPQRMISMVDQRSLERKAEGYTVEFIDQDSNWNQTTQRILRPNKIQWSEEHPGEATYSPMKLDFTTSYNQAMWHARRIMAKEIHRPGEVSVQVGKEGRYFKPGSLIKVQHERHKIGVGSGEITELIKDGDYIVGLKLMEYFDIASDRDYWVEYYVVDTDRNHVVTKQIKSVGEYTDRLMFTVPIPLKSVDAPIFGNILSAMHGEGFSSKVWEAKRYIVSDLSENEVGYDLKLVEYSDEIYNTTTLDKVPERRSSIISSAPRIYNDVGDRQLVQENRIPDSREISNVANNVVQERVPDIIPRYTPKYRGITNIPDHDNTGIVNGNVMNPDDYIMYSGDTEGIWEHNRMYQWKGKEWEKLSIEENRWKYLDGVNDLTEGLIDGLFGNAFVNTLIAKTAIIDELFSRNIRLHSPMGSIQSEDFLEGTTGFSLQANNRAVFNNEVYIYNLKVVGFEIVPPSGSGTLIANLIGFQSQELTLTIGWYEVEMAGGGGGRGGNTMPIDNGLNNWVGAADGGQGAQGGYIKYRFYNSYNNSLVSLNSGSGGANGTNGNYSSPPSGVGGGGGGGGGAGSTAIIKSLNIILIACGGGGGGGGVNTSAVNRKSGGGGGGGGYSGNGGRGGNGDVPTSGNGGNGGSSSGGVENGNNGENASGVNNGNGGIGGFVSIGGDGGGGGQSRQGNGNGRNGLAGSIVVNGNITNNVGGGSNANGGNGFIKLIKLS